MYFGNFKCEIREEILWKFLKIPDQIQETTFQDCDYYHPNLNSFDKKNFKFKFSQYLEFLRVGGPFRDIITWGFIRFNLKIEFVEDQCHWLCVKQLVWLMLYRDKCINWKEWQIG